VRSNVLKSNNRGISHKQRRNSLNHPERVQSPRHQTKPTLHLWQNPN
jgi:hypothetical protein